MAKKKGRTHDVKLAQKLITNSLNLLKIGLYRLGRPFYWGLVSVLLTLLYLSYITGHQLRKLTSALAKLWSIRIPIKLPSISATTLQLRAYYQAFLQKIKQSWSRFVQKTFVPTRNFIIQIFSGLKLLTVKFSLTLLRSFRPHPVKKPKVRKARNFIVPTLFILLILSPIPLAISIFYHLPSPKDLTSRNLELSTKIYDRHGQLLFTIYKDKNRSFATLNEIPLHVRLATLAAEDAEFYSHPGISVKGIARAIIKNVSEGKLSGGSTITQQLVKNALLTPEKTLRRKLREAALSLWTETQYSKDEILEMYLNEVAYGGPVYGIKEAARTYFNKDINKLTLGEAAMLAGFTKSPTKFSPYGTNPEQAYGRQAEVLNLMQVNGYITDDQRKKALEEKITFAGNKINIEAPHFVMNVRAQLEEMYGQEVVEQGGLKVITTLDLDIQKMAEEVVKNEVSKLSSLNVTNGAVIIIDPQTGDVLTMVGSKNYFDTDAEGNVNVTTAPRQPGSSIKVVNYAYALGHGYTPASIIDDSAVTYLVEGQPPYLPTNYDGAYRGNITLRSALAESRNIPAVKVLASYGVKPMVEMGQKMGISTWNDPYRYGLSLTLGGGEVKLIDLATVYATLANYGKKPMITSILSVTDSQGKTPVDHTCQKTPSPRLVRVANAALAEEEICRPEEVLDPRIAFILTDILRDNNARAPAFGTNSQLVIPGHTEVAVKTGTSNNLRDNLTVGYTQNFVVAVWVGNNDNSPMSRVASGVTGASPIFNKIMSILLVNQASSPDGRQPGEPNHDWEVPAGLTQVPICTLTGTQTCEGCPTKNEWFIDGTQPQTSCNPEHVKNIMEGKLLPEAARTERQSAISR